MNLLLYSERRSKQTEDNSREKREDTGSIKNLKKEDVMISADKNECIGEDKINV